MNFIKEIDDDDDILNDPNQLFIEDEQPEEDNFDIEPEVYYEPDKIIFKTPLGDKERRKQQPPPQHKETEIRVPVPVVKEKIPEATTTKHQPEAKETSKDTKEAKDDKHNVALKCKNHSDCDSNSFCILKTGKCTAKLQLNESGCDSNDECAHPLAICYSKSCMLSCKVGSDSICKAEDEGLDCVAVKDLKVLKGFKGKFNGVCDKVKSTVTTRTNQTTKSTGMKNSSIALISGASVLILALLIICFIYLRGRFRRRHRNNNPDMFLFNKLQRSATRSLAMAQKSNSAERLNARLASVNGARFTRWSAMGSENGCNSP